MSERDCSAKNIMQMIGFCWVLFIGLAFVTGCSEPTPQERFETYVANTGTPNGATNIEIIDEKWYTFEYNDQCFLATRYWRHAALTKIDCED